ncbi:hypothetical protein GCM10020220_010240 [Nonomuraea rubra]
MVRAQLAVTMCSHVLNLARPSKRPMLRATASNVSCEASSASLVIGEDPGAVSHHIRLNPREELAKCAMISRSSGAGEFLG